MLHFVLMYRKIIVQVSDCCRKWRNGCDGILNVRGEIKSARGTSEEEEGDEQRRKEEEGGGGEDRRRDGRRRRGGGGGQEETEGGGGGGGREERRRDERRRGGRGGGTPKDVIRTESGELSQLSEAWSKKGLNADRTSGTNTWQTSIKETQAIELCIFFIISTFQELLTPGSGRFHDLKSMEAWPLYRFVWNPFLLTKWCKKVSNVAAFVENHIQSPKLAPVEAWKVSEDLQNLWYFSVCFLSNRKPQNWRRCLRSWRIPFRSFLIMWVSMRSFLMRCHWKSHPMVFTESIQSTHSSVIVIPSCEHLSCHLHTSYCRTFTNQDEGKRAILSILSAVWFLKASDLTISMIWRCFVDNKKRLLGFHLL